MKIGIIFESLLIEGSGLSINGKKLTIIEALNEYKRERKELQKLEAIGGDDDHNIHWIHATLTMVNVAIRRYESILKIEELNQLQMKTRNHLEYEKIDKQIKKLKLNL